MKTEKAKVSKALADVGLSYNGLLHPQSRKIEFGVLSTRDKAALLSSSSSCSPILNTIFSMVDTIGYPI